MLFKPSLTEAASGKLGGLVFSHNRAGSYVRRYVIPTNPRTSRQVTVRNRLGSLTTTWAAVANKGDWATWAGTFTLPNALGDPVSVTAKGAYILVNMRRLDAGKTVTDTAPNTPGLSDLTAPTASSPATNGAQIDLVTSVSDAWAAAGSNGALIVQASAPQALTINSYSGPYRFIASVSGSSAGSVSVTTDRSLVPGTKVFLRFVGIDAEGRPSPAAYCQCFIT